MRAIQTILVVVMLSLVGCSPDNPTINSFDDEWRLLVSGPSGLMTVRMPSGSVETPNVWTPSDDIEPYPVRRMKAFRDKIFLVLNGPEVRTLSSSTLQPVDTITWSVDLGAAVDITFANATTAFVALENNAVGVIDLTVNTLVSTINVGGKPFAIEAVGNQICVSIPDSGVVKIIDSRTNAVEATIAIPTPRPAFIAGDGVNNVFCVVAYGAGTTPTLSFLDIPTRTITKTVDLTARASEGPQQVPMGIAVNASEYAYVPVQNALIFASTRTQSRASAAQFDPYGLIQYNSARAELICIRPNGKSVVVFNEFAETVKQTAELPDSVNGVLGIAP